MFVSVKDVVERAVKTGCQTLAAWLTASGVGLLGLDWTTGLSLTGFAVLLSLLTSVGSGPLGTPNTASAVTLPVLVPEVRDPATGIRLGETRPGE